MKNNKNKLRHGELTTLILYKIAENLIESGRFDPRPNLPRLLGNILKLILDERKKNITKEKLNKTIKALEKRRIIRIETIDDKAYVHLEEKGKRKVTEYSLKILLDLKQKSKKWDGKWFMVFFDVPEIERKKRDYLRYFLKKIGFYQYQLSVYLFPYECEKEIALIKEIIEGGKYMNYVVADRIENEVVAKKQFSLI